jgi:murein DD-endopeptidase MepM/ murein hydrolase activator NlpD
MPAPLIAANALRIGALLTRGGKGLMSGVSASARFGRDAVTRTAAKISTNNRKIRRAKIRKARVERNTKEIDKRRARESQLESRGAVKPTTNLVKRVLQAPLNAFLNLIAAWSIRNLPFIIKQTRIFIKRIRILGSVVRRMVTSVDGIFRGMVNVVSAFMRNAASFDWNDSSGRLKAAQDELNSSFGEITSGVEEFRNVWTREEEELNALIEGLDENKTLKDTLDSINLKQYMLDIEPSAQPQTSAVGEGSGGPISSGAVSAGNPDLALLATIAALESGSAQGQADVAQSVFNRLGDGTYGGSLRQVLLADGQYQPAYTDPTATSGPGTRTSPEFAAIQDEASAIVAIQSYYSKRGQGISEDAARQKYRKALAAVSNPSLQAEAAKFVGGRTEFLGAGNKVSGSDVASRGSRNDNQFFAEYGSGKQLSRGAVAAPEGLFEDIQKQAAAANKANTIGTPTAPAGTGTIRAQGQTSVGKIAQVGDTVSGYQVTSSFGQRWGRLHGGIDVGTPNGTYIAFTVPVEVVFAGRAGGYGNVIDVWAPSLRLQFRCAHLMNGGVLVKVGDKLPPGVPIGRTGNTGSSTGPHLHFEVDTEKGGSRYGGARNRKLTDSALKYVILSGSPPLRQAANNLNVRGNPSAAPANAAEPTLSSRTAIAMNSEKTNTVLINNERLVVPVPT